VSKTLLTTASTGSQPDGRTKSMAKNEKAIRTEALQLSVSEWLTIRVEDRVVALVTIAALTFLGALYIYIAL
jgi:hypothetical protein